MVGLEQIDAPPAYEEREKPSESLPEPRASEEQEAEQEEEHESRFMGPTIPPRVRPANQVERSSRWRRLLVIIGMILVFWVISSIRSAQRTPPKVVHASRYSKEHKFRPAASPIITETLKDGRTRIRGAEPIYRATETATARPTAKAGKRKVKKSAKRAGTRMT